MSLKLKNLKRGFTLVELMIVVAIVGILAALAVYGVSKYMKSAKSTEAREGVGGIANAAMAAYDRESIAPAVLAPGATAAVTRRLCGDSSWVPANLSDVAQEKYQSSPEEWNQGSATVGWQCLKFSMNGAQVYRYQYDLTAGDGIAAGSTFSAIAQGDLDGDDTPSVFNLNGALQADPVSGALNVTKAPTIGETNPEE